MGMRACSSDFGHHLPKISLFVLIVASFEFFFSKAWVTAIWFLFRKNQQTT